MRLGEGENLVTHGQIYSSNVNRRQNTSINTLTWERFHRGPTRGVGRLDPRMLRSYLLAGGVALVGRTAGAVERIRTNRV
jgi:hypothetical protein